MPIINTTTDTDFSSETYSEIARRCFGFTKFGKTTTTEGLNRKHTSDASLDHYLNEINCVRLALIFCNYNMIKKVIGGKIIFFPSLRMLLI